MTRWRWDGLRIWVFEAGREGGGCGVGTRAFEVGRGGNPSNESLRLIGGGMALVHGRSRLEGRENPPNNR